MGSSVCLYFTYFAEICKELAVTGVFMKRI